MVLAILPFLFFVNTKLFLLYLGFFCKLFPYIFHVIRQIAQSLLLHFLRNTESGFGDGTYNGSDGIAIATVQMVSSVKSHPPPNISKS